VRYLVSGILLALAMSANAAEREADCVLEKRGPSLNKNIMPDVSFRSEKEQIGSSKEEKLMWWNGIETAQLQDNIQLETHLGGCESFTNTYLFTLPKMATPSSDKKFWHTKAADMLSLIIPANMDSAIDLRKAKEVLKKAAKEPERSDEIKGDMMFYIDFPTEGFGETFFYRLIQKPNNTIMEITYSVGPY
jgi:hypothetical protein